jgi:hypothetical protein
MKCAQPKEGYVHFGGHFVLMFLVRLMELEMCVL